MAAKHTDAGGEGTELQELNEAQNRSWAHRCVA